MLYMIIYLKAWWYVGGLLQYSGGDGVFIAGAGGGLSDSRSAVIVRSWSMVASTAPLFDLNNTEEMNYTSVILQETQMRGF